MLGEGLEIISKMLSGGAPDATTTVHGEHARVERHVRPRSVQRDHAAVDGRSRPRSHARQRRPILLGLERPVRRPDRVPTTQGSARFGLRPAERIAEYRAAGADLANVALRLPVQTDALGAYLDGSFRPLAVSLDHGQSRRALWRTICTRVCHGLTETG